MTEIRTATMAARAAVNSSTRPLGRWARLPYRCPPWNALVDVSTSGGGRHSVHQKTHEREWWEPGKSAQILASE